MDITNGQYHVKATTLFKWKQRLINDINTEKMILESDIKDIYKYL